MAEFRFERARLSAVTQPSENQRGPQPSENVFVLLFTLLQKKIGL